MSQVGRVYSGSSTLLLRQGHLRANWTGLCLDDSWTFAVRESQQPLWAIFSSARLHAQQNVLPFIHVELPMHQFLPLSLYLNHCLNTYHSRKYLNNVMIVAALSTKFTTQQSSLKENYITLNSYPVYCVITINKSKKFCPEWPWSCCVCCWRELQLHLSKGVVSVCKPELVQADLTFYHIPHHIAAVVSYKGLFEPRKCFAACLINSGVKKSHWCIFTRPFCWL